MGIGTGARPVPFKHDHFCSADGPYKGSDHSKRSCQQYWGIGDMFGVWCWGSVHLQTGRPQVIAFIGGNARPHHARPRATARIIPLGINVWATPPARPRATARVAPTIYDSAFQLFDRKPPGWFGTLRHGTSRCVFSASRPWAENCPVGLGHFDYFFVF